jgi:Collagen triple helix repeat (20 copies)
MRLQSRVEIQNDPLLQLEPNYIRIAENGRFILRSLSREWPLWEGQMRTAKVERRRKNQAGERGLPGPPGPPGRLGLQGKTGSQGLQGLRGKTGLKGKEGSVGPAGQKGREGAIGPAGRVGTVKDMAKQVHYIDRSIENIYNEMGSHIKRMTQLQSELDSLRDIVRRLAGRSLAVPPK